MKKKEKKPVKKRAPTQLYAPPPFTVSTSACFLFNLPPYMEDTRKIRVSFTKRSVTIRRGVHTVEIDL